MTNETPGDGAGEPKPAGTGGTQASAAAAVDRAATSTGRWWASALALLAVAFCVVVVWIVAANTGSDRFGPSPARTVNGAAFQLTRGGGHPEGTSFIVESLQDGIASASAEIQPFSADRYPRVEWDLRTIDAPAELLFAWRTRDNPRRTYSKQLLWIGGAIVPLRLSADDGWRGTITDIALVARGSLPAPLEVRAFKLPSTSVTATLGEMFTQWGARFPLKGYAVAYPFDAERTHFMPIAKALGIACVLATVVYLGLGYLRSRKIDWRIPVVIFAAAWIVLDLRWQIDLGREVADAAHRFAGKTPDEKALAADDAPIAALAFDIRKALPPPPVRVFVLCDSRLIALRVTHFLFPQNASRNSSARDEERENPKLAPPKREALRSGDHLVLLFYSGLRYDAAGGQLVWPNGETKAVDVVLSKPEMQLVRIK